MVHFVFSEININGKNIEYSLLVQMVLKVLVVLLIPEFHAALGHPNRTMIVNIKQNNFSK